MGATFSSLFSQAPPAVAVAPVVVFGIPVLFDGPPSHAQHFVLATQSGKFRNWLAGKRTQFSIKQITIRTIDMFGPTNVGFISISAQAREVDRDGHPYGPDVPGIGVIRGPTVVIGIRITVTDPPAGQPAVWLACTQQPRFPYAGTDRKTREATAGMADISFPNVDDDGNVLDSAVQNGTVQHDTIQHVRLAAKTEVLEEMNLCCTPKDMKYCFGTSQGLLDEQCSVFSIEKMMSWDEFQKFIGQKTGTDDENITVDAVPWDQIHTLGDSKANSYKVCWEAQATQNAATAE